MMVRRFAYRLDIIRNGVTFGELRATYPPTIIGAAETKIRGSLSASVIPNENVDIFNDIIRPVAIIDGVEHELGEYYIARLDNGVDETGFQTWNIEAYDRNWILEQTKIEKHYAIYKGSNVVSSITQLLTAAGIVIYRAVPSDLVMPNTLEWQTGTSYLEIINALLDVINYDNIFFDLNGCAVIQPYAAPSADNIAHVFDGTSNMSIIARANTKTIDVFNAPNVFIAVCASADSKRELRATAVNDVPTSELSILRRGRRIVKVIKTTTIADQATLQAYIEKVRNESLFISEQISITTALIPGVAVNQTIAIQHPEINGLFREKSWSIKLGTDGQMTHKLQRMVIV